MTSNEVGDVIKYKLVTPDNRNHDTNCIRWATVTGICLELNKVTKTVLLNIGNIVVNSLHMMCRNSIQNIYSGKSMWNPMDKWWELSILNSA